jgi:hypothetical protein
MSVSTLVRFKSKSLWFALLSLGVLFIVFCFYQCGGSRVVLAMRYGNHIAGDKHLIRQLDNDCLAIYSWLQNSGNDQKKVLEISLEELPVSNHIRNMPVPPRLLWRDGVLEIRLLGGHAHASFFWVASGSVSEHKPQGRQLSTNLWWWTQ